MTPFATLCIISFCFFVPDANFSLFLYDRFVGMDFVQKSLSGKRVWITGCTSGIGEELAMQLHSHGARLILSGRRKSELQRVKENCLGSSHEVLSEINILPFDITSDAMILTDVVKSAVKLYDGIDILILNAGVGQLSPALDDEIESSRVVMDVNFWGPFTLSQLLIKLDKWGIPDGVSKRKRNGHIVVTSSVASKMALPLGSSYAASKAAVNSFFSSLRSENGDWLRVDISCPGPIATSFQDKAVKESINFVHEVDSPLKMPVKRCARLIITALVAPAFLSMETWISSNPTLTFMYINQHFPKISNLILSKVIGPLRLKAFRSGLPLYKLSSFFMAAKEKD